LNEKLAKEVEEAIEDFDPFLDSIENERARTKAQDFLQIKLLQLRQTLSVPEWSTKFQSIATDHAVRPGE